MKYSHAVATNRTKPTPEDRRRSSLVTPRASILISLISILIICNLLLQTQVAYARPMSRLAKQPAERSHTQAATLNTHPVATDAQGKLISWLGPQDQAYDQVIKLAWDFLINRVPRDANRGNLPAYYLYPYVYGDRLYFPSWPHNPADAFYGFTESALAYYPYSGDDRVITLAKAVLDFHLANGMTAATDAWANVPYASSDAGATTYRGSSTNSGGSGDGQGVLEPDKVAELGLAFLKMYQFSGDAKYLTAAINAGNALAINIRACDATAPCNQVNSPWPFRVVAATNAIRSEYSAHVTAPIKLLDELIRLNQGNVAQMQVARQRALTWLLGASGPIATNRWDGFFEDIPNYPAGSNATSINPLDVATYLMQHPEVDPNWQAHVAGIFANVEAVLGETQLGVLVMREQQQVPKAMGSHTARYAAVKALWYQKTGDAAAKEAAFRAFNWATYMANADGQVIDFPGNNNGEGNSLWWTDGYGDYIRHFMAGMALAPEWAPAGQDKLLSSSSVVKSVSYRTTDITYLTFDAAATETLKLNAAPASVMAGGVALPAVADLNAQAGWTYDAAAKTLRVRHDLSGAVVVSCSGAGCAITSSPIPTSTAVVATPMPSATLTATAVGPTPTSAPSGAPTVVPSATPVSSGQTVVSFDDQPGQDRVLSGSYAGIDWGSNLWYLSAPWGLFTSKSISFNGSAAKSASFALSPARRLISFDVYSPGTSTVSAACAGQPTVQITLTNQVKTLVTNWTGSCSSITLSSSNGWDTNFDNLVLDAGVAAATLTPAPPTPTATSTATPVAPPTTLPVGATSTATAPVTPPSTPVVSGTSTSTATPTVTPVQILTATSTAIPSATSPPAPTAPVAPSSTPIPVIQTTATPTVTPTATSTALPAPSATRTLTPTARPASTSAPAATATRTPTRAPVQTSTPTSTPTRALTRTATPGAQIRVSFDDLAGQDRVLTGAYPNGVINWGNEGQWFLSAPWGLFTTKSVSFNGAKQTSAALNLLTPRRLVSVRAYNGSPQTTAVTLQCAGQTPVMMNVAGNTAITIPTGWAGPCSTITFIAANGWDTNFDDLVLQ